MNDDRATLAALIDAVDQGRSVVLATVVRVRGSTPREAGAKMLVDAAGAQIGTIGGGCGEGEVLSAAREVLRTGRPRLVRVDLTERVQSWSPAVCGGIMDIFVERVEPARS